ncbi:hypothetical protein Tco_1387298, partial [Tanacetum coccineum]
VMAISVISVSSDSLEESEGAMKGTYETLGALDLCCEASESDVLSERISELERDNMILRGTLDVASQRVTQLQRRELRNSVRASDAPENLKIPCGRVRVKQEDKMVMLSKGVNNNGNEDRNDNGNGNRNGGGNGYNFGGFMPVARECTYQDFLKCHPLNFNGTKGVVGLTRWFVKMDTVFHINNLPQKYQVKYATCTLLNSALTWWNSHKRAIGFEAAYVIKWTKLIKLMTKVYSPRNEIQKMVSNEEDKVERFIGGLPDNIQGNVNAAEPTRLQDAIRIANNLMDQKLKGYAKSAKNKRRFDNNPRDNHG